MNSTEIESLANIILDKSVLNDPINLLIVVFLIVLAVGLSNFLASYMQLRGRSLATKADFQRLLYEQKETTRNTESIKQEITHKDWANRELKVVRREKLEELLESVHGTEQWLLRELHHHVYDNEENNNVEPIYKVNIVGKLYFPELTEELFLFHSERSEFRKWILYCRSRLSMLKMQNDRQGELAVMQEINQEFSEYYQRLLNAISGIESKAEVLMSDTLAVNFDE